MKWIKYIFAMIFFGLAFSSIPDILINLPLLGKENVTGAIGHVLLGLFLVAIFTYIAISLAKSAQRDDIENESDK
jgi:uncharacterized membrane protein YhhN